MRRSLSRQLVTAALAVVMLTVGCSGKGDDGGGGSTEVDEAGDPVRGGSVTYALEAETGGGWCLPESQLAISGIMVARSIYDTLTVPAEDGTYVPYLAEAVEHDETYTTWTITVRDGVTFHDGTPLTAEVVKNNLDAIRGAPGEHARSALLGIFVLQNVDSVEVSGTRDVVVTMKTPWVAFDAYLYGSGRFGIMAQAQLDDTEGCNRRLIGTGPFVLEDPTDWVEGREFRAVRNPDYWQDAPDGEPYPYLDEIVFTPVLEAEQRLNGLLAGDLDAAHFSGPEDILEIRDLTEDGTLASTDSAANAEVGFLQLNTSEPPFDDVRVRRAIALAIDRDQLRDTFQDGDDSFEDATGPYPPESPGYLDDTGFPLEVDLDGARRLIAEYESDVGPLRPVVYQATPAAGTQELAVFIQQSLAEVGFEIDIEVVQQDALIDNAISGDYDLMAFRNYPGGDPDGMYVWLRSGSPVNFSRIADPEIDRLLDEGRAEPDPAAQDRIYQDLNRRLGEQAYSIWLTYTTWMVASSPNVHGYSPETAPDLPDGSRPSLGLATGHATLGLWRDDA